MSVRRAEGLSLTTAERMNWKTVGTFFNMLEKLATANNLSNTPGNILNADGSDIQLNNKSDSVIIERESKMFMFYIGGKKSESIGVIARYNVGGQFLRSVLIFKYVIKKQEFGGGVSPGLDVHMNRKSSYIGTELFNKSFTKHFLKHKLRGSRSTCRCTQSSLQLPLTALD